ncbi:hypothetical protein MNBD_GAMMA18-527 [hydrothermal vent metagenome]|uniref:Uncharacterized protein n=1 Tax=hydrothermal vent metagenome TaxID=652676 RepID=A0A3B0ZPA5_9ZZZZ
MKTQTDHEKQIFPASNNPLVPESMMLQGGIIEIITHKNSNELELILSALTTSPRHDRWIAWVGAALQSDNIKLQKLSASPHRLLHVHLREQENHLKVLGKALSTGRCSAVIARSKQHDAQELQQLRIAAYRGKTIGILLKESDHQGGEAIPINHGTITPLNQQNKTLNSTFSDKIFASQTSIEISSKFSQNNQLSFF